MAKQQSLGEGFGSIQELDDLIEVLQTERTTRLHHLAEERKHAALLIAAMHRHHLTTYGDKDIGTFAEIVQGDEKIKVRTSKKGVEDEDGMERDE